MPAKGYWDKDNKGLTIKGMQWDADFEEFKHKNARDPEVRDRIVDYLDKNKKGLTQLWYNSMDVRMHEIRESAHEITEDEAVKVIVDNIPQNLRDGWFREANSEYKPAIIGRVLSNPKLLNAAWNMAYHHYVRLAEKEDKKPLSFMKWLYTPTTMYRGHTEQNLHEADHWVSYSLDKNVANKFAGTYEKSQVHMVKIRPIDTLGAYNSGGEAEIAVPRWRIKMRTK